MGDSNKPACTDSRKGTTRPATAGPWSWTDVEEEGPPFGETTIRTDILGALRKR
jgi:hypothetical protein